MDGVQSEWVFFITNNGEGLCINVGDDPYRAN